MGVGSGEECGGGGGRKVEREFVLWVRGHLCSGIRAFGDF